MFPRFAIVYLACLSQPCCASATLETRTEVRQSAVVRAHGGLETQAFGSEAKHLAVITNMHQQGKAHKALMRAATNMDDGYAATDANLSMLAQNLSGLSTPIHVATWNKTAQKECCNTSGHPVALDLFHDNQNGGLKTLQECHYACVSFPGCRFFEIDATAEKGFCRGYPDCDHKCDVSWNSFQSLYLAVHEFAKYDAMAQEVCCNQGGNTEYLDLKGDAKNHFNVSGLQCEQACANHDGCMYWEHSGEDQDLCYGYGACDYLCMQPRGKAMSIYHEFTNCDDFACPSGFLLKTNPARIQGNSVTHCCDVVTTTPGPVTSTWSFYPLGFDSQTDQA